VSPRTPLDPARSDLVPAITGSLARPLPSTRSARSGVLAISAGAVFWGTTGSVVRYVHAATGLSAAAIGCYRLGIAAVVLIAVRPRAVLRGLRSASARPTLLLVSGAGLGAYQALYFLGVQLAGVSVATLVSVGLAPVITTLGAAIGRRRRPAAGALVVLAGALAGLALICLPRDGSGGPGGQVALGLLASVGSGVGYGLTVLVNRRAAAGIDALTMTVATSAVGVVVLVPLALRAGRLLTTEPRAVAGLAYIGVLCTALAYGLFYAGLRTTASEVAVVLTLFEPLTATVLAAWLLSEPLSWPMILGAALMLISIAALYRRPDR
jgi:drug/metabolite transporter (DMT)-like permease